MSQRKKWLPTFFFELFIVFIGVYGAFELNRLQENRRENEVKVNYLKSFRSELVFVRSHLIDVKNTITKTINDFEMALANGDRPSPKPIHTYISSSLLITQAGLNGDVFLQLNQGLAASLSGGYDNVSATSRWLDDFNDICNRNLISNSPIQFYDRQGNLRPEFDWYLPGMKTAISKIDGLLAIIDQGAMPSTEELIKTLEN